VRWVKNALGHARLGLATPRRYGGAVRRNRFRRVARAAFRAVASRLESLDVLVEPRLDLEEPTLAGITADLLAVVAAAQARPAGGRP
jgi:ribonuclease P protein component